MPTFSSTHANILVWVLYSVFPRASLSILTPPNLSCVLPAHLPEALSCLCLAKSCLRSLQGLYQSILLWYRKSFKVSPPPASQGCIFFHSGPHLNKFTRMCVWEAGRGGRLHFLKLTQYPSNICLFCVWQILSVASETALSAEISVKLYKNHQSDSLWICEKELLWNQLGQCLLKYYSHTMQLIQVLISTSFRKVAGKHSFTSPLPHHLRKVPFALEESLQIPTYSNTREH